MPTPKHLTPKQAQWFKKIRQGLETETGKPFEQWIAIAKTCPETKHAKRLKWFKENHGLGINRASTILGAAFETGLGWDNPAALLDHLWKTPELRAIYDAIETHALTLGDDVILGPRKFFSAFSRKYQFAAARPVKGVVRLGLALDPIEHDLEPAKPSESWSDRLTSVVTVASVKDVDKTLKAQVKAAWKAS